MKDKIKKIAKWFTISAAIAIVLVDIVLVALGYSVSEIVRDYQAPHAPELEVDNLWCVAFYISAISGHWTIQIYDRIGHRLERYIALLSVAIVILVLNLTVLKHVHIPWYVTVPGGLTVGALLWPQRRRGVPKE